MCFRLCKHVGTNTWIEDQSAMLRWALCFMLGKPAHRVTGLLQCGKYSFVRCSSIIPGCRITQNCVTRAARIHSVLGWQMLLLSSLLNARWFGVGSFWPWSVLCSLYLERRGGVRTGQTSFLNSYCEVTKRLWRVPCCLWDNLVAPEGAMVILWKSCFQGQAVLNSLFFEVGLL